MLAAYFHSRGDAVTVLARQAAENPWRTVIWNGHDLDPSWLREIEGADVVINLAGRSVNCRYHPANRREIKESRLQTTRLIGRAIGECAHPPAVWMNASTATIYRHSLDRPMDEATGEIGGREAGLPSTWKFSIDVATSWEEAFFSAATPCTRKIALRSAMVMWPSPGGIFTTLLSLVRAGLGGRAGTGKQFVSWIHGDDFIRALEFLIAHGEFTGIVNVSAPSPLPNYEFMRELRRAACVRIGLPAAKWILEIGAVFLRSETELILKSRRVVPARLLQSGFEFRFPRWGEAADNLIRKMRERVSANEVPNPKHSATTN